MHRSLTVNKELHQLFLRILWRSELNCIKWSIICKYHLPCSISCRSTATVLLYLVAIGRPTAGFDDGRLYFKHVSHLSSVCFNFRATCLSVPAEELMRLSRLSAEARRVSAFALYPYLCSLYRNYFPLLCFILCWHFCKWSWSIMLIR